MAKDNYVEIVRQWDSTEAENLGKYTDTQEFTNHLNPIDVRANYVVQDPVSREELIGTMPENAPEAIVLDIEQVYTIPFGRHSGEGTVTTKPLYEYTQGTAKPENIDYNYVAWVNGERIVGTKTIYENEQIASATEDTILEGYDAWVHRKLIKGRIPILQRQDVSLLAGESYTFPYGMSGGTTVIAAVSLAEQTPGNATSDRLFKDDVAWSNGVQIVGTFDPDEYVNNLLKDTDAIASEVRGGKKFYSAKLGMVATGTAEDFSNQEPRTLRNGESITVPKGFHDGSLKISVIALKDVTIASADENSILVGNNAWVNGELIEGKAHQYVTDATDTTATEYDIREGKTAYINGYKAEGKNPYNMVNWYSYDTNTKEDDDVNISMVVDVPIDRWESVGLLRIEIFDDNGLNILNHIDIENYLAENRMEFDEGNIIIDSDYGNSKITITDNRHRYLGILAVGYSLIENNLEV